MQLATAWRARRAIQRRRFEKKKHRPDGASASAPAPEDVKAKKAGLKARALALVATAKRALGYEALQEVVVPKMKIVWSMLQVRPLPLPR